MKTWIILLLSLVNISCGYNPVYNGKEPYPVSPFLLQENPRHTLDYFIEGLAKELLNTNNYLTSETPLAVVSFVDVEKMDETNWLGNTITEGMIYQMQRQGFTVIDYKNTGAIRVTPKGDFTLSRDWNDLVKEQEIDYVLTGTMLRQGGGLLINARVLGMKSRIVVASAQGFLPADRIGRDVDSLHKVRMYDGKIYRDEKTAHSKNTILLKP